MMTCWSYRLAAAGAAGAGSGGTSGSSANRVGGIHGEPVVGHVDLDIAGFGGQFLIHEEGELTNLVDLVSVLRLIQSQSQSRASSAAGCEVNPHRCFFFIRKVAFQLLLCGFSHIDHLRPPYHWLGK